MRISDWSSDVCSSDLVRQFHSFGVKSVQLVGPWTLEIEQMRELSPEMLNGMILGLNYYQDIDTPVNHSLVERYVKAHKTVPSYAAAYGYDRSEEHTSELQSLMRLSYAAFCMKEKRINI